MKNRTVKTLAAAAVLSLTLTGCSTLAPVATTYHYDPSDGVGLDVDQVDVRNMLFVADEVGGAYNLVLTAVNNSDNDVNLVFTFVNSEGEQIAAAANLKPGTTKFGSAEEDGGSQLVLSLGQQEIGSTVETYLSVDGGKEYTVETPVLDGTLEEYKEYVVDSSELQEQQENSESNS